jgi:hypothetical protein
VDKRDVSRVVVVDDCYIEFINKIIPTGKYELFYSDRIFSLQINNQKQKRKGYNGNHQASFVCLKVINIKCFSMT